MVVDEQQEQHQRDADGRAPAQRQQHCEHDEEAELAEDVGRGSGAGRHARLEAPQRQAHREPEEEELAQEQGNALAAQCPLDGGDGGLFQVSHILGELVEMQEDIPPLDDLQRVYYQMLNLLVFKAFWLDFGHVDIEGELPLLLDRLEDG